MTPLLDRFIPEARDYVEGAAAGLLRLERDPSDEKAVNEVFRAVHTLKGGSGLFDIPALTKLVHAAEDLLGEVRAGRLQLKSDLVDLLLDSLDRISAWIDDLERWGHLPTDADRISQELTAALRRHLPDEAQKDGQASPALVPSREETPPDWLAAVPETERLALYSGLVEGGPQLFALSYSPDEDCFYRGEDPLNLFAQLAGLKTLQMVPRAEPAPLSEIDPFRCRLDFRALAVQPRAEIEHLFRYVIEQLSLSAVPPEALILPEGEANSEPVYQDFGDDAQARLAAGDIGGLRDAAATLAGLANRRLRAASALRWLEAVLAAPAPALDWAAALAACIADGGEIAVRPKAVLVPVPTAGANGPGMSMATRIIVEQRRIAAMPGSDEAVERRLTSVQKTLGNLLTSLGWARPEGEWAAACAAAAAGAPERLESLLSALEERSRAPVPESGPEPAATVAAEPVESPLPEGRQPSRILKVDQGKIDILMTLIAELVVSKNGLPFLAKRAEEIYGSRPMSREIKEQYAVIDRLAQEMQRAIMDVRMLPVSDMFARFPRLVRDLARKLNKQIDLRMTGEDTAADKAIIEALGDPLIHLVRNAIDHGIEMPDRRVETGKPAAAVIHLKAFQEGDRVVVEVSDDGKGIDPAAIRAKAVQKGLISEDKADTLSEQEAVNLVFLPGFSTAGEITDLSGRGVGMDVVRSTIDRLNGLVEIASHLGKGTTVRLSLPLSMAVTRVMMIEAGGGLYGIPMDGVAEIVRVPRRHIRTIKQAEAFVLRDAIVPLIRLHALLGVPPSTDIAGSDEGAVLVARVGGVTVGLGVDRFREGIDVILRPMEGMLAGIRGYSGTALLGDGRVLLVLNLKELL